MTHNLKGCPACGIQIEDDTKVLFSCGTPGSKARLRARVCQFTKKEGCINDYTQVHELECYPQFGFKEPLTINKLDKTE